VTVVTPEEVRSVAVASAQANQPDSCGFAFELDVDYVSASRSETIAATVVFPAFSGPTNPIR